jgi:anaerobic selenocysteine-containing dehydrogenase
MYMSNMAWNSAMNVEGTIAMLTAKDEASGGYKIPRIIYSDAYFSEMVAYADLILPDTTYLERWDCISMLDRPISSAEGPADSIRQPVVAPDRDVRPFQDVLLDLGARLDLPGMTREDATPTTHSPSTRLLSTDRRFYTCVSTRTRWRWPGGCSRAALQWMGAPISTPMDLAATPHCSVPLWRNRRECVRATTSRGSCSTTAPIPARGHRSASACDSSATS